ncbi:hypothetical protein HELRODRAFT_63042, partial [Helobdella robusta]|uniref:Elongation of very long chain fatty acids protein n=1 Tax=Helobdella robusta TaxID=6412 RepID=T1FXA1_HELRO
DPRTKDWLLLSESPKQVHVLSVMYLAFVLLGPIIMQHREAFQLKGIMIVYNLSLVMLSIYMFVEIVSSALSCDYGVSCAVYNKQTIKNPKEIRVLWWYFFSKAIELFDTVLMILRKKNNQVTFLHVFHHVSMLNIWWRVMVYIPGGLSYFGSALNCVVHVVMYTYYGLSVVPQLREHLWWKKYLTMFQLVQFVITFVHTCASLYVQCDFPVWGQWLMFYYMIIMLILFSNFYLHAYVIRKEKKKMPKMNAEVLANGGDNGELPAQNGGQFANGYDSKKKKSA